MSTQTLKFYETTIGKKIVMAISGAVLLGFVLGHMLGNLLIFNGDGGVAINDYAASLRTLLGGNGIWAARVVLARWLPMRGQLSNWRRSTAVHGNAISEKRAWRAPWLREVCCLAGLLSCCTSFLPRSSAFGAVPTRWLPSKGFPSLNTMSTRA